MKQERSELARRNFRDLLDDAQQGEATTITRNGKAIAALVPIAWLEDMKHARRGLDEPETTGQEQDQCPS